MAYGWLIEHADKKQREDIDKQLNAPPPGVKAEVIRTLPEWQPGAAGNDFLAQMQSRSARGVVDGRLK